MTSGAEEGDRLGAEYLAHTISFDPHEGLSTRLYIPQLHLGTSMPKVPSWAQDVSGPGLRL